MSKKAIISINCEIPGGEISSHPLNSKISLLDWDIVIFKPGIHYSHYYPYEKFQGKPSLTESDSFASTELMSHWKREIREAVQAGKTVFIILTENEEVYVDNGERSYSGTGRNQKTTRHVILQSNFDCIPTEFAAVNATGKEMVLSNGNNPLISYWKEFGALSEYRVRITCEKAQSLIVTKNGGKSVGAMLRAKQSNGTLFLLPFIALDHNHYFSDNGDGSYDWSKKGEAFGKKFVAALVEVTKHKSTDEVTPLPDWANHPRYQSIKEKQLLENLLKAESEIRQAEQKKSSIEEDLDKAAIYKRLLFEKGTPLEEAIIAALLLFGFQAEGYRKGDSEFDVVFYSNEGRFLGEAEGKDNKAINIDKLRQLTMNVQEDLAREEIATPAEAVMFGNGYRLTPLEERPECFTEKCLISAKRYNIALVRTCDLLLPALYLSSTSDDIFAKHCRAAILESKGEVVRFPTIPEQE